MAATPDDPASEFPSLPTQEIRIDRERFTVEVADTPDAHQRGLMYRRHLDRDKGMLFPYPRAQPLTFWMKDCEMSLDILYFQDGRLVSYVDKAPPCRVAPDRCPMYPSRFPADTVVELKAGSREKYGFSVPETRLKMVHRPKAVSTEAP